MLRSDFNYKRGQVVVIDFGREGIIGSEQGGIRPCVVVQNDKGNTFSPTIIVVPITSSDTKNNIPTHMSVNAGTGGLTLDGCVLAEQIKTVDKKRCVRCTGKMDEVHMKNVDRILMISLGLI